MHRPTVGIIALVLLILAAGLWFSPSEEARVWHSGCLRVGLLMGAVWLAHPHLKGIHPKLVMFGVLVGVVLLVVALKHPLQIALLAVILLLVGFLRMKTRKTGRADKPRSRPAKTPSAR